ncbi:hypothetical protein QN277_011932 [Acacia crassicarpa]|uniref:Reverse transcriptase domain-containing protein n=1 Tax=Acacia crassicarpa TaxID=499986 RepID=A0AAE1MZE5_9FABA|nr:hypothetical protein QN277_011932 [Acacia crassicarpa]
MWIHHENYNEFLNRAWPQNGNLDGNLASLQTSLGQWNRETFGMVERKKQGILNSLEGIQRSSPYPFSNYLCSLELELQNQLENLLNLEEIKWFQKSRSEWVTKGDRNTRYYHLKSKARMRRNRVSMLKNEVGKWIDIEEDLKALVIGHFKDLFCSNSPNPTVLTTNATYPSMDPLIAKNLSNIPSGDEIRTALFSMGSYKAPGFDGFPPIFYKSNWGTVGPALVQFVQDFFEGKISVAEANKTLISLIPKLPNVELVTHFRPISLCTVHYKCISKVIALKLREVIDGLISPFQASFIKGRCIQDNIIVGHEIIHIMNKNRSKRGLMAMKVDLEKAYDRIS